MHAQPLVNRLAGSQIRHLRRLPARREGPQRDLARCGVLPCLPPWSLSRVSSTSFQASLTLASSSDKRFHGGRPSRLPRATYSWTIREPPLGDSHLSASCSRMRTGRHDIPGSSRQRRGLAQKPAQIPSRQAGVPEDRPQRSLRYVPPGVDGHRGGAPVRVLEPVMAAARGGQNETRSLEFLDEACAGYGGQLLARQPLGPACGRAARVSRPRQ